ncbi:hypothetical protein AAIR98_001254 [Elusimicrobium simillimum]|uniref:hypothetical protein n=1 Tax=Elusimicrobium simillimum TaxID=3143438 RepID=UPI003C6F671D
MHEYKHNLKIYIAMAVMVFIFAIFFFAGINNSGSKFYPALFMLAVLTLMFAPVIIMDILRVRRANKLLKYGAVQPMRFSRTTHVVKRSKNTSRTVYYIEVKDDNGVIYKSHGFDFQPSPFIPEELNVFFDVKNPKKYFVDTREVFIKAGKKRCIISDK